MPSPNSTKPLRRRTANPRKTKSKIRKTGLLANDGVVFSYLTNMPRAPALGDQIFKITQTVESTAWFSTSTTLNTFANVTFFFNQIDQASQLGAVFDQYRIDSVEIYFTNQGSNLNLANTGRFATVVDFDDSTNLTTFAQALDYPSCVVSSCQSCQYRHIVPRIAVAAYSGSVFTQFLNMGPQWVDVASSSVEHYGIKVAATPTIATMVFDLTFKLHVSLRATR